ncbi:hypothetical protein GIB67_016159 [Kingdonia uniflora]|uniref:Exostosin GT47 domain-containing protein n=1 Tax=Kingdonia uniflora TaxID=39325 RepID=A0A7J7N997_9MAGN|nr:hypothetical protein GIB67_016159 [Kingdonia uniflora]
MTNRRTLSVYLCIPNIIGYIRILMNVVAFARCFEDKKLFSILYFISFVCNGLDGWFARKFNQVSTFGAVLDMVTNRARLVISTNWLFKAYYGNRLFMAYCCVASEMQDNYGASGYFLETGGTNKRKHVETLKLTKVSASDKLESFRASQETEIATSWKEKNLSYMRLAKLVCLISLLPLFLHLTHPSLEISSNENFQLQTASVNTTILHNPIKKEFRCNIPPKSTMSIIEMDRLLIRRHSSYRARRPQLSSTRDQELFSAKLLIENAPITSNDRKLHAPLFRNASMFSRSYELMERTLKVYIYKEGEKPIFHQPILKGIYASEGWFMKLMQENKKFLVKDPKKAHIFYMPFSTRMLEFLLYVRNLHNRTNLAEYLKNYTNMIASKYSFWNRTGGADHFFVACHDWVCFRTMYLLFGLWILIAF